MALDFKKGMIKRICILAVVVAFLFGMDAFRVFYLQMINGDELAAKAESQQLSDTQIPAKRGTIYDSDGNVLAQSATVWDVYIDPSNIDTEEKRALVVDGLSQILEYDEEKKAELLETTKKDTKYAVIEKQVENDKKEEIAAYVAEHKLGWVIRTTENTKRYYPYGSLASSVLGFVGGDNQGLSGIESYYNKNLTGTNGRIITVKDANLNKLPTDYETSIDAIDGNSLVLTINQNIQYYLEKDLRNTLEQYQCKGAYGIVMDCNTGAVLAMSSLPDFDCNEPYKVTYNKVKKEIKKKKGKEAKAVAESAAIQNQWRNFTVSDTYVPALRLRKM